MALHERVAERLFNLLVENGGLYIKIGVICFYLYLGLSQMSSRTGTGGKHRAPSGTISKTLQ